MTAVLALGSSWVWAQEEEPQVSAAPEEEQRARLAELRAEEEARHAEAEERLREFQQGLVERQVERHAVLDLLPLATGREERADAVYLANQRALVELRNWLDDERRETKIAAGEALEQRLRNELRELGPGVSALTYWRMERELAKALEKRRANLRSERDRGLRLLAAIKGERRQLLGAISATAREQARRELAWELREELREIPEVLELEGRETLEEVRQLPQNLLRDWNSLERLVYSVLGFLFLLWSWRWLRRASGPFLEREWRFLYSTLRRRTAAVETLSWRLDLGAMAKSATPVAHALLDLIALFAIYRIFTESLPVLGPLNLLLVVGAAFRLLLRAVEMALIVPGDWRPGFLVSGEASRRRLIHSVRWLVGFLLIWWLSTRFLQDGIGGDRLAEVLAPVLALGYLLLIVRHLLLWYPSLHRRAVAELPANRWSRWLQKEEPSTLGRLLRAAVGFGVLVMSALVRGAARYGKVRWLRLFVARSDLIAGAEVERPLEAEVRRTIFEGAELPMAYGTCRERLRTAFEAWKKQGERGSVVLLGNHGMGKSSVLTATPSLLGEGLDLEIQRIAPPKRLVGVHELRTFLADSLGCEASTRAELQEHLAERAPTLFLVDDLHLLLLRTVGGFAALEELLGLCHQASERHFWVLTCHRPAWMFLKGAATHFHHEIFRDTFTLEPWNAVALESWLLETTRAAGFEVDFERLRGAGQRVTFERRQRVRQAYWRLLAESSDGNPEVALALWLDGLCQGQEERALLEVTLPRRPAAEVVSGLPRDDLFVLAALALHDSLRPEHLWDTLNLPAARVEISCRHLDGLDLVETRDEGLAVSPRWLPTVMRVLEQSHFLHGR